MLQEPAQARSVETNFPLPESPAKLEDRIPAMHLATRTFKQVAVFTEVPFLGNPAAVVLDAEALALVTVHLALMLLVHREPGEDHHRYRVTRQPLHHPCRRGLRIDTADGEAVEADHHVAQAADVGQRAVGFLVDERVALQELVQRGLLCTGRSSASSKAFHCVSSSTN